MQHKNKDIKSSLSSTCTCTIYSIIYHLSCQCVKFTAFQECVVCAISSAYLICTMFAPNTVFHASPRVLTKCACSLLQHPWPSHFNHKPTSHYSSHWRQQHTCNVPWTRHKNQSLPIATNWNQSQTPNHPETTKYSGQSNCILWKYACQCIALKCRKWPRLQKRCKRCPVVQ